MVSILTGTAKLRAADCARAIKIDRPDIIIFNDGQEIPCKGSSRKVIRMITLLMNATARVSTNIALIYHSFLHYHIYIHIYIRSCFPHLYFGVRSLFVSKLDAREMLKRRRTAIKRVITTSLMTVSRHPLPQLPPCLSAALRWMFSMLFK